jgi:hypothetical protein
LLVQVVASVLTERRLARLQVKSSANALQMGEYINWLSKVQPVTPETAQDLSNFTEKTPTRVARRAALGEGPPPKTGKGKGKGKKKK